MSDRIFGLDDLRQRLLRPPMHVQEASTTIARLQGMPLPELVQLLEGLPRELIPQNYQRIIDLRLNPDYIERRTTPRLQGAEGAPRAMTNLPVGAAIGAEAQQLLDNLRRYDRATPNNNILPIPEGDQPALPPLVPPASVTSMETLAPQNTTLPLPPPPAPPIPPVRPRSPVVTPDNSMPGPQTPVQPDDPVQQVQSAAKKAMEQGNDTLASRLMAFGFAMAASRSPSLFGQIGEAGQQMLQHSRQEREQDLRRQQIEGQISYQDARIRLLQAELDWMRDPTNPQNIQRLANARADLMRAAATTQERDHIVAREVDRDGNVFGITRSGRAIPLSDPQGRPFQPGRDEAQDAQARRSLYINAYTQAMRDLSDPLRPGAAALTPQQRHQMASEIAQQAVQGAMGVVGIQRGQQAPAQVQAPPPVNNRTVIDLLGRPIQQ